jgi:hypothetical protein
MVCTIPPDVVIDSIVVSADQGRAGGDFWCAMMAGWTRLGENGRAGGKMILVPDGADDD